MAITRTLLPGDPDENNVLPYAVHGTGAPESYTTQPGDQLVYMHGGNDRVNVAGSYLDFVDILDVHAGPGNDVVIDRNGRSGDVVWGGRGNDRLMIDAGDESSAARGKDGNDVLRSLGGDEGNGLYGGRGDDVLHAAPGGRDYLVGGPGNDRFHLAEGDHTVRLFTGHTGTSPNRDLVLNFDPVTDIEAGDDTQHRIDLSGMDANPGEEGDQAFDWVGHNTAGPMQLGNAGYFLEGDDAVVVWVNGGGRQALVLDGLADRAGQLDASDFWL